ncbi:MAG: co-chaperone DjlA [Gammaproteobacteria bacterium]|jgi:DnaJ like chaperone protein|nr:co-chaperone DjlA [Gammaproteobacteria bacterium]
MAWWGKLIGGAFGFMLGGPLGAMLGAALGHQVDTTLGRRAGVRYRLGDQERVQTAFFTATFSIMGHVAKADGRVSEAEIALAKRIMAHMGLSPDQRRTAINLFNTGKQPNFPLDDALDQFRRECHHRHTLMQMFLELQLQAAFADRRLDPSESTVLLHIFERLGFSRQEFEYLVGMVRGTQQYYDYYEGAEPRAQKPSLVDAYAVLGVSEDASDEHVRKAYRRLMSQHHPDKLVAKGLPEEMVTLAKEKAQEINRAYDQISAARRQLH